VHGAQLHGAKAAEARRRGIGHISKQPCSSGCKQWHLHEAGAAEARRRGARAAGVGAAAGRGAGGGGH